MRTLGALWAVLWALIKALLRGREDDEVDE